MREVFRSVSAGRLAKEAIADVVVWLSKNEGKSVEQAMVGLGLGTVSDDELKSFVDKVIVENKKLVEERGEGSFSVLMGIIMKDFRGRIDAAQVSKVLKERLKRILK
jgi:glutamyl-tRNA(Gln) amidotransferase subunit E